MSEKKQSEKPVSFIQERDVLGQEKPAPHPPLVSKNKDAENLFERLEFPSLVRRIQALTIDAVVLLTVFILTAQLVDILENTPAWIRALVFIFMFYIYEPLLISYKCTLGQYFMGIRVRSIKNPANRISLGRAYLRFLLKALLGWLSFITISFNPRKRAIHDFVGASIVVRKPAANIRDSA